LLNNNYLAENENSKANIPLDSLKPIIMKRIILFLTICFPIFLSAQTVTVSEGLTIRNDKGYAIIGKYKDKFLLYREKQTSFEIQAFDNKMRTSWKKEIELDKKRPAPLEIVPAKDYFSLVYQYKLKGDYALKINRYDPAANLMDSLTFKVYDDLFYQPKLEVIHSEDKNIIVVYFFERQTTLHLLTYDIKQMKLLWDKKIVFDDSFYYREFQQLLVNNEGEFFFITGKDNKKNKRTNHLYEIFQFNKVGELIKFTIPMQEYLTYDIHFTYDNLNRKLLAAGLFSEKSRGKANGYFFLKIPPKNPTAHTIKFNKFDDDFLITLSGKEKSKSNGLVDTDIQEIVLRKDGGILVIAEKNKEYERRLGSRSYGGREGRGMIVDYYYDDIFVISIHPDGETHWKTILHKKQYSQDDGAAFSSFFLLKTPNSIRFLFNDEIRFENTVSEYVVDGMGSSNRNSVMSTEDQNIQLRFREGLQVGSNEFILPSERRNRLKLVRVVY